MATITKTYAEQLSDLKALEALGTMPAFAVQEAAAEALRLSEGRPYAALDAKYVILATDTEMAEAAQRTADEIAAANSTTALRAALDATEAAEAKADAQIQSDLNMTPAEVNSTVDTIFAGFTAPQRTFLKRLVRMVLAAARKVLR